MKKLINKFLNKKSNFSEDAELKVLNEELYYLLGIEKDLLAQVIVRNIKYFYKYKKTYIAKFLLVVLLYFSIGVGVIAGSVFTLNYLNVLRISKGVKEKSYNDIVFNLKDSDTTQIEYCKRNDIKYNIIFETESENPDKNWEEFKIAVRKIETQGLSENESYLAVSGDNKQYWGRYQMGTSARKSVGLQNVTWKEFSQNRNMQEGAFEAWIRLLKTEMQSDINRYTKTKTIMNGIQLTESGIIAMAHNVGVGGAKAILRSNGTVKEVKLLDGSIVPIGGTPMIFLKLGGYSINFKQINRE